jgi:hypothetical protein
VRHLLGELLARHAQVDLGRAFRRDDVDARCWACWRCRRSSRRSPALL